MEWQPIETVPEDEDVILFDKYEQPFIGRWSSRCRCFLADTSQLGIDGDATFRHDIDAQYITHWMYLPTPPKG